MNSILRLSRDVRILYALGGVLLSIVAHECVHALFHFGDISAIYLFPNAAAIVSLDLSSHATYDLTNEEMIAYAVTALIQLVTVIDVFAIHDSYDRRPLDYILADKGETLSEQDRNHLLHILSK